MELKVSSLKPGGLSPSDCNSDPEEKEISDEDDDDRNHKHRRREARSQSIERDSLEPVFTRSYRKRNKPFENGHPFRDNESQGNETWKDYNIAPLEKDFATKFDKRRPGMALLPRTDADLSQRIRSSQLFPGEPGSGRGRGRDIGSWNQRDSRFNTVDIAPQMIQQGSITPGLFAGRGLPNVSNAQNASWNTFGLIPGIPNSGLDAIHSIGLQGTLRPALNSSFSMSIPRQRCRDFDERGFCLRGDMCPMEHGVNRIVVEDVQSLSQFNLPVSLSSAPLSGAPAGPVVLPSANAPPTTLINSKGFYSRNCKSGMVDDAMGFSGAYSGSATGSAADLYDPDQPLWNTNGPETSSGFLALNSSKNGETASIMSADTSDHHRAKVHVDNELGVRNANVPDVSQATSSSVWGRVGNVKNRMDKKGKINVTVNASNYLESETKGDQDALANTRGTSGQVKQILADDSYPKTVDSSARTHSDTNRNIRKSSQKALRTLFVSGIPQRSNRRDTLLSHFQKFGEVIDIYIPSNSERAFVQFSKREEAEAALKAPDAVMGNRFIKLWWANRDSIPEDGISGSSAVSATHGVPAASVLPQPFIANRGKDNFQSTVTKGAIGHASDVSLPSTDHPKPLIPNGPMAPPPSLKKLELEQLKEELRKKQELLAQKRNDFWRQLSKLEKLATGVKSEVAAEPSPKRHRVEIPSDGTKTTTPGSSGSSPLPRAEMIGDKNKSVESPVSSSLRVNTSMQQETACTRHTIRPMCPAGPPFPMNRYKLDNRARAFRILPPLPPGLNNVDSLKEHFSSYGDLSSVELEGSEVGDNNDGSQVAENCSARVSFTTRHSAERAFSNGKCWQGNDLQFMWLTCSTTSRDLSGRGIIPFASKCPVETDEKLAETSPHMDIQDASASGNMEPETSERNTDYDPVDSNEVSAHNPTSEPSEKDSPKCDANAMSVSNEGELQESETGPAAISEGKDSPASGSR